MRYLNPKADLTFKRVFGEHPDLVISLLNALLPLQPEQEIESIEYLPSELMPENPLRKNTVVDVRCKDNTGRQFLVEMQMIWSPQFQQRVLFNASKAYIRQIGIGENYDLLHPVYSLNLVNDIFEPQLEEYYHYYRIVHEAHSDKVIEGLHLVFVELPKFTPHNYSEKKMQVLWLRYLTEIDEKTRQVSQDLLDNPEVNKAVTALEESAFTDAQLAGYEKFWDIISVEKTLYTNALRKGMSEGLAEGLAKGKAVGLAKGMSEGLAEGLAKGISEGLAKGKAVGEAEGLAKGKAVGEAEGLAKGLAKGKAVGEAEGLAKGQRLIATNLKKQGIEFELIAQCTGLSLKDIAEL